MAFQGWALNSKPEPIDALASSEADAQHRFDEIVQLLVAAGYFRARISALSAFDRVVGGLAWCITASSVEVDIAFTENATIGAKIKMGEGIERALRKMKCRYPLQAHQVQGLDYFAIFPVVQWLVKQFYELRQEISQSMRSLALSRCVHHLHVPMLSSRSSSAADPKRPHAQPAKSYTPCRRFRARDEAPSVPANEHAVLVLREFGVLAPRAAAAPSAEDDAAADAGAVAETAQGAELSHKRIGKLVGLGASEIQKEAGIFAAKAEELLASGEMAQAATHVMCKTVEEVRRLRAERALAERQLQRERAALQAEGERASLLRSEQAAAADALSAEQQARDEARRRVEALAAEAAALAARVETAAGEIAPTERLLADHTALKRAQADFKKECAAELRRLQEERRRQAEETTDDVGVSEQEAELSRLLEAEEARRVALRQQLAQRSREAGVLQRRVDERPSRAELMQFERRYRELYRQLASKSEETKKYFSSFNALEEERGYLQKEVSLINSIHDSFAKAGAAPKDKLVESIEGLVRSVQGSLEKVQQRLGDDLRSKNALQQKYDEMVEKQRRYFKLVREFQEEAQRLDKAVPP